MLQAQVAGASGMSLSASKIYPLKVQEDSAGSAAVDQAMLQPLAMNADVEPCEADIERYAQGLRFQPFPYHLDLVDAEVKHNEHAPCELLYYLLAGLIWGTHAWSCTKAERCFPAALP